MKKKPLLIIFILTLFCVQANAQNKEPVMSEAGTDQVTMGDRFIIDSSNDNKERQFPFIYKFGKNIFVSYCEHNDMVIASPMDAMMISRDNGKSWIEKLRNNDFYISSIIKKGGVLYGIVYFTYPVSSTKERMIYWTSGNNGKTWSKKEGVVKAPEGKQFKPNGTQGIWGSMLFHRGMQVMKDGSVQGVMYGHFDGDSLYSSVWVKSTDNCATWNIVSTIATGKPKDEFRKAEGYCEPNFAITKDGSILCVMRIGSYLPLYQSRSLDNGITWSNPVMLPGLTGKSLQSVYPQLLLMKNGVLALTYGRPGTRIAFSTDGCGYLWNYAKETYEGQTTGYSGIIESSPGKLLLVSDQGRTGDKALAIWGRFMDVHLAPTPIEKAKMKK
ncbi:MAG: sialidase family protein [Bacteroidota bacterium]|nr:sialidase family protein [Bacteroidota bacterium]